MKTREELLKIYSAYLPYHLNIAVMGEFVDEDRKIPQIFEMVGLDTNYVEYHELGRTITEQTEFTDVFPHLWSMDYLTKEIEHKGERFIPINELKHFYGFDYMWSYCTNRQGEFNVMAVAYACVAKLLEWKFNIFNLSDDEYVKLQTITCIS